MKIFNNTKAQLDFICLKVYMMKLKISKDTIIKLGGLMVVLMGLSYISKNIKMKEERMSDIFNNKSINKYLEERNEILKSTKPILWIHIPYEANIRNQSHHGSPISTNLNQPYINLTVKSIIDHCGESFTICVVDDTTFEKLIPNWEINMSKLTNPTKEYVRFLGLMRLLYIYGGFLCPKSFLCQKDLKEFYDQTTENEKFVIFEEKNKTLSRTDYEYLPNIEFCCCLKNNDIVDSICGFLEELISTDYTNESNIINRIGLFIKGKAKRELILEVHGGEIGILNKNNEEILLEDLFSDSYVDFEKNKLGILIPSDEINRRKQYEWFQSETSRGILLSDYTLAKQIALTIGNKVITDERVANKSRSNYTEKMTLCEKNKKTQKHVGYWETPLGNTYWGLKPNYLGDKIEMKTI